MSTALRLVHSASTVVPIRAPADDAEAPARRRPKAAYVQSAKPAAPRQSRMRQALVHVERLSECIAVGVITQVVTLTLKAYGFVS